MINFFDDNDDDDDSSERNQMDMILSVLRTLVEIFAILSFLHTLSFTLFAWHEMPKKIDDFKLKSNQMI